MDIQILLKHAIDNKASDIHLSSSNPPIFRVHGNMVPLKIQSLPKETVKEMIYSVLNETQKAELEENLEIDLAIPGPENNRFRMNIFYTEKGIAAVLRLIPREIATLQQLNAPQIIENLTSLDKGLILVTGPTGSGKSTTLASMVDFINQNHKKHIITIEDPIEFVHNSKKCLINQRELGSHTKSFAKALKSALREDPDVILVGEMRDLETIHLAITAAETGHLVFGTLHTSSAPQTIDRIIDVFPAEDKEMIRAMLSNSLEAIIAQTLLRKVDGLSRIAIYEVLLATPAVRNLIREGKIPQIHSIMQMGAKAGMVVMKDSIDKYVQEGIISEEVARSALNIIDTKQSSNTIQGHSGF